MTYEPICKKCGSKSHRKYGFIDGNQRYRCKDCGCQYTDTPPRGVHPMIKKFAVFLYSVCGVSMIKIGKVLGVSHVAVLKWIRAAADNVPEPVAKTSSKVVMLDEMWHYVNGKKTKFGSGEPFVGCHVAASDGSSVIVLMPQ